MNTSKNVKVGIFLVCGAVLFAAGLFLIGNHNQVFAHHFDIYTEFVKVDTLQSGAKIRVSGMDAGEVSDIQIPKQPAAKFRLKLHVDKKFQGIIRQDSIASIETEGMVGDKYVNIATGSSGEPECAGGCTLPSEEPVEISDLLQQGKDLLHTGEGAIANIKSTSGHADQMILSMRGNVDRIAANGAHITNDVSTITSNVKNGRGTIGELLTNDEMARGIDATIAEAKRASTNLAADTEAIKHNFFLRGFFHRRGYYNLAHVNPTEYASSEFVKHPNKRIWLPADSLFTTSSNGAQQLSMEGRATLDHAISEFASELPKNPIMIEGYAETGSESDRYLAASQRAAAVKNYLESRLQLKPELVGAIPLEDKPPRGTGKDSWNGVCLAVVVSRS